LLPNSSEAEEATQIAFKIPLPTIMGISLAATLDFATIQTVHFKQDRTFKTYNWAVFFISLLFEI